MCMCCFGEIVFSFYLVKNFCLRFWVTVVIVDITVNVCVYGTMVVKLMLKSYRF